MKGATKRNSKELQQKIAEVKKELRALHRDKKRLEQEWALKKREAGEKA